MEQTKPDITEFYRRVALPLMGLAEVIGTQGRSPGTVAQRSMQQFDTADEIRRRDTEAARKMAMEEALYGAKIGDVGKKRLSDEQHDAKMMAFKRDVEGGMEETQAYKKNFPFEYAEKTASTGGMGGWISKQGYEEQQRIEGEKRSEKRRIEDEKRKEQAQKEKEERQLLMNQEKHTKSIQVPGLVAESPEGITPVLAKQVKEAMSDYRALKKSLKEYRDMYNKYGRVVAPSAIKNQMVAKKRLIQLTLKGEPFLQLGVLTGPDMDLLNQVMPDATFPGVTNLNSQFDEVDNYLDTKFNSKIKAIGYGLEGGNKSNSGLSPELEELTR